MSEDMTHCNAQQITQENIMTFEKKPIAAKVVGKNVYQRMLGVMGDLSYIQKAVKPINGQYRAVNHDQVASAIHPLLVKHGLFALPTTKVFEQDGNRTKACVVIKFINADDPKDCCETEMWGYGVDSSDKGPGKAVSYAFKYCLLKAFMLETGDDPDNDQNTVFVKATAQEVDEEMLNCQAMTIKEIESINELIGNNEDLKKRILVGYKVPNLCDIPRSNLPKIINTLTARKQEQVTK